MGMRWRWRFYATLDAEIIGCDAVAHDVIVYDIHFIGFWVLRIACIANSRMNHIEMTSPYQAIFVLFTNSSHDRFQLAMALRLLMILQFSGNVIRNPSRFFESNCDVSFIAHETLPMKTQATMRFCDYSTWQRWFPNGCITFRRLFCLSDGTRWVQGRTAGNP